MLGDADPQVGSGVLATHTGSHVVARTTSANSGHTTQLNTSVFTAFSGERISFRKENAHWQAIVASGCRAPMGKRILPVVSQEDVATSLMVLQAQDRLLSRSRIHIMRTAQHPYTPCVYIGKHGLMGGGPDEGEPTLRAQLHGERLKRKRREDDLKTLRAAYELQLSSMETEKEECESQYEELSDAYTRLQVLMDDKNQLHAVQAASKDRELESYKAKYKQLHDQHKIMQARTSEAERLYSAQQDSIKRERKRYREEYDKMCTAHAALQSNMEALEEHHNREIIQSRWCLTEVVLGKEIWEYYIGDVGEEPALPADILSILNSSCPFFPGKKVRDTHLLVLIPAKINGKSFTLDLLDNLARSPKNSSRGLGYCNYNYVVKSSLGIQSHSRSYWVLMSRCVFPPSSYKRYKNHQVSFSDRAHKLNYMLPSTLEAATVILLYHLTTGQYLYPEDSFMYTMCRDYTRSNDRTIAGGFSPAGLNLVELGFANEFFNFSIGVAGLRKL